MPPLRVRRITRASSQSTAPTTTAPDAPIATVDWTPEAPVSATRSATGRGASSTGVTVTVTVASADPLGEVTV